MAPPTPPSWAATGSTGTSPGFDRTTDPGSNPWDRPFRTRVGSGGGGRFRRWRIGAAHQAMGASDLAITDTWRNGGRRRRRGIVGGGKGIQLRLGRADEEAKGRKEPNERWLEAAKQLLSGAMSAVVARTCCAPLERVKLELLLNRKRGGWKVFRNVLKSEGVRGLWKGNLLNIARTAPFKAINFYSFEVFKNHFLRKNGTEEMNGPQRFVAGAGAGITAVSLCFPLDMIRTRLLVEGGYARYGGFRNAVVDIFKSEGPKAFYIGITPALISLGMSGAVFYGVYDMLKLRHLQNKGLQGKGAGGRKALEMGPAYTLLYGAMAGVAAEFTVYPLEVIRRRLQLQSIHGLSASQSSGLANMGRMFVQVVQAEGLIGLYSGVMPTAIQVMPSAALSYFTYEAMKYAMNA